MPLSVGDRLGLYEILAPIGAGGMGEVYRARDCNLKRDVALKILPDTFTHDPERVARFHSEAKTLAALNHPNIATIFGFEDRALAMELVEGENLKGPLPVETALRLAQQLAEALEYAHERGVIHRDLKPANIKVTADGVVKVLDFGLAKAIEDPVPSANPADSPTITLAAATRAGVILGTAAYMSPEQAHGKNVDRRADIWSFGAVFYEMLTGEPAFKGDSVSDTLASVLKLEPNWNRLPSSTSAAIRKLLRRCLTKDRTQRLQAIGDVRIEIEEALSGGPAENPEPVRSWRSIVPWVVAGALAVVLAIALWAPWVIEKPADRPLVRLDVDLGADVSLPAPSSDGSTVAISPDGTRLAYRSGTPVSLFTRGLDQPTATALPGTQGASTPFFSPDGRWVGFYSDGRLNKISVAGGAVVPLAEVGDNFAGATWSEDGSILVSGAYQMGLLRIPAGGGPTELVAGLGNGEVAFNNPQALPGGRAVLFSVDKALGVDKNTIEVLTLADGHRKVVARGGSFPRYLATSSGVGHLLYVNKATLFAISFDLAKLETSGTAVPVVDDVAYQASRGTGQFEGSGQFDFSPAPSGHGTLVYRRASGGGAGMMTLQWVDPTGKIEPLRAKPGVYTNPNLSSDATRVTLTVTEGGSPDIWVYDLQRDTMTRLTFGGASYRWSTWSPDGQYVVFTSDGSGIFQARADGVRQPQALTQGKPFQWPWSFTPDGKRLAYFEATGNYQIWTVPLEDTEGRLKARKPEQFLKNSFNDVFPSFSPNGRWLAYRSNESGKEEVYVRAFPPLSSGPGKWQISNGGGDLPHWSQSGHDLLYQSGNQIMATSYTVAGDTFVAEKPRVWLAKLGAAPGGIYWDLAPDGKRVLVLTPVESPEGPKQEHEVVFLENFFDELRRRVPVTR